jgi:hypothetical protein
MSTNSRIPNGNTVTRMSAPHRELTVTDNDWLLRGLNLDAACQVCTLTMFYRFHKFFFFFSKCTLLLYILLTHNDIINQKQ